jgi:hypothetical protein
MMRLSDETLNPNLGAGTLQSTSHLTAQRLKTAAADRAWKVTGKAAAKQITENMLAQRVDQWSKEAVKPGRRLGYDSKAGQGDVVALMKKPGIERWDLRTAPMSMREVEAGVRLVMDTAIINDSPAWKAPAPSNGGNAT